MNLVNPVLILNQSFSYASFIFSAFGITLSSLILARLVILFIFEKLIGGVIR